MNIASKFTATNDGEITYLFTAIKIKFIYGHWFENTGLLDIVLLELFQTPNFSDKSFLQDQPLSKANSRNPVRNSYYS